jgi:hypothetical protein
MPLELGRKLIPQLRSGLAAYKFEDEFAGLPYVIIGIAIILMPVVTHHPTK